MTSRKSCQGESVGSLHFGANTQGASTLRIMLKGAVPEYGSVESLLDIKSARVPSKVSLKTISKFFSRKRLT